MNSQSLKDMTNQQVLQYPSQKKKKINKVSLDFYPSVRTVLLRLSTIPLCPLLKARFRGVLSTLVVSSKQKQRQHLQQHRQQHQHQEDQLIGKSQEAHQHRRKTEEPILIQHSQNSFLREQTSGDYHC